MPTTMVVRFVFGRYHATPWGRHVNEGQVELPPSPWRLLRALYATWRTRRPDLDEPLVHGLLARLAAPPTYFVPPHKLAHTRHYLPDSVSRRGNLSVDRTLDAFAAFDRDAELGIRWPEGLDPDQAKALADLAEALPYLGRADSICEARLDPLWQPGRAHQICSPLDVGESIPADLEVRSLLCPALPLDLDALVARPVDVRANKLLFPPATRFVSYPTAQPTRARPARQRSGRTSATVVRLGVVSTVRPPITDAVTLADWLRRAAVKRLGELRTDVRSDSLLAGRFADGTAMQGHLHAHYLALPDSVRRVGELVVWAPGGLPEDELEAIGRVRLLRWPEGMPAPAPVELRPAAVGAVRDTVLELVGPALEWESATPFVPARHAKRDWPAFLASELRRELAYRSLPAPVEVEQIDGDWRQFTRYRLSKGRPKDGERPGAMLRLQFAEPVQGPLALGYLSHFGLGLFRPLART